MIITIDTVKGTIEEVLEKGEPLKAQETYEVDRLNAILSALVGAIAHTVQSEKARLILLDTLYANASNMIKNSDEHIFTLSEKDIGILKS